MNQQEPSGELQSPASQCSNASCQATFTSPVQHCLTCGALLRGMLLSGRFRVEDLLGRGGMGAVYRATDLALGRAVALKVLSPNAGVAGDAPQELRARFFREARVAAQLDHPNIVPVLHFDIDGPLAYLVMSLLTGGTLARRLRPRQPADPAIVAGWLRQMAAALDFAHQRPQPIIHRDVKPGNLLFHEDGRLCLADFGIARVVAGGETGEAAHLTRTGVVLGSLSYMAPEQINGRAVPASDQYSTGIVLYEALTGALPFDAADNYGLIIQHSSATPPLPSEYVPGLPGGVDAVVMRALAKQPEERFPTVGALAQAFESALTSTPTARIASPARQHATQPVAPRPTFRFDDQRGELPTEAGTLLRPPPGQRTAFWGVPGVPPQKPPTAPGRRGWWVPALFAGLAVMLLCVVGLAGLSLLSHPARTQGSQTATSVEQSPTATPTPTEAQRAENLLLTTESNGAIIFRDSLIKGDRNIGWLVSAPGTFTNEGLRLPTRTLLKRSNDTTVSALIERQLPVCDVEVNVKVTTSTVTYGLGLFPLNGPGHVLILSAAGFYAAGVTSASGSSAIQPANAAPDLALTPGSTYPLEVIIQRDRFIIFLNKSFVAAVPFSPGFSGSSVFALASVIDNGQPPASVTFSDLKIYALA
jgi:hypothetical protein